MPAEIAWVLSSEVFRLLALVLLTSFFWVAGLFGLCNVGAMVGLIRSHRLPMPRLIVAMMITTELVGSALLVSNYRSLAWLGAGALGVFTLLSIPLGHAFWKFQPPQRMAEFQIAQEHVALVGGLACAAALSVNH